MQQKSLNDGSLSLAMMGPEVTAGSLLSDTRTMLRNVREITLPRDRAALLASRRRLRLNRRAVA